MSSYISLYFIEFEFYIRIINVDTLLLVVWEWFNWSMYGEQNLQNAWWAQKIITYMIRKNEWKRRLEIPRQISRKIWRWYFRSRYLGCGLDWTGIELIPVGVLWWQGKSPSLYAPFQLLWQTPRRRRKTNSLLRNFRFWRFNLHDYRIIPTFLRTFQSL